jgi:hypothetical protein
MGCFNDLIANSFLKNALNELAEAKQKIKVVQDKQHDNTYFLNIYNRKVGYKTFISEYDVLGYIREELLTRLIEDKHLGALLIPIDSKLDTVIFCFSASISTINKVIKHYYNVDGVLPYYRGKHRIYNKNIHTVLLNIKTVFPPNSLS